MQKKQLVRAVLAVFAAAALLGAGYVAGTHREAMGGASAVAATPSSDKIDAKTGRKVLYWHDPMVPNQHFDKPGKSPFMNMQLEPVYADEGGSSGIRIDAGLQQNLGIRYATVRRQDTAESFDAVGTTQFDESMADVVQSRVTGYIDQLYASAPMQRVAKGAPIASLFVPDWLAPQEEYLALKRGGMDDSMLAASRARMRAMSIPEGVISSLDRTGKAQTHVTLSAPETGVLTELNVRDGAMVSPGQTLAKVAGLSRLWLIVEVPEALALQVRPGMTVDAVFAGDPTQHFTGHIREILPGISTSSRTLQARLEIDNAGLKLTPGMLMRARIGAAKPVSRLLVPSEAVITTGKRSVVIARNSDGRLQPVEVTVGNDAGDNTEVTGGLTEGQQVVASGQFLIDSEASLKSVLPKLVGAAAPGAGASATSAVVPASGAAATTAPAAQTYETTGKVEKVTPGDITFSHQPVPALGWGAMTMTFGKPSPTAFPDVKAGEAVHFVFRQSDDGYMLTKVEPVGGAK
ncbi:efflux RND transporter periplasmic adaptor subunit [Paraburkholderia fungorum]|jgi:Cu(I)/Ag(I) efflux system membrane fusion protein|uniref:Cu(I)/Ag(I) efflux system membrane fusion protein n=1 Tax=Paraburkholderia fungorum TaxID=134537 RepID=A0AAW3V5L2_9BURK|nr:efflux RND transporter periplasmic adaptor subunit [Paraburkholderia fungorum]AJZ56411.1 efflux transporter, RND family, MFP subunit [Paraburkholderia fungorum]MBB4516507.1 Cu(I)/Ag(I) efflux system membrane fusion protein [Paraburkholderia fungorum]MBB5545236.1 Cu(I)/Ag(I) efflux system membrane fusion protein [Paraburkholderia fungorum]MBB6205020.1 Cu(I)/Ag(I) efflux system membrane fusion protein [Paraburkholderia fungorum]MBU7440632.1 efflux RND transporter periplasmic adaptor subunit [